MAKLETVIDIKIKGQSEAEGFLAGLGEAAATLRETVTAPMEPELNIQPFTKAETKLAAQREFIRNKTALKIEAIEEVAAAKVAAKVSAIEEVAKTKTATKVASKVSAIEEIAAAKTAAKVGQIEEVAKTKSRVKVAAKVSAIEEISEAKLQAKLEQIEEVAKTKSKVKLQSKLEQIEEIGTKKTAVKVESIGEISQAKIEAKKEAIRQAAEAKAAAKAEADAKKAEEKRVAEAAKAAAKEAAERVKAADKAEAEILKNFQAQLKAKDAEAKAQAKAEADAAKKAAQEQKDAFKNVVLEKGFLGGIAAGDIKTLGEYKEAAKILKANLDNIAPDDPSFLDAEKQAKEAKTIVDAYRLAETGAEKFGKTVAELTQSFFVFNAETGKTELNIEAVEQATVDLEDQFETLAKEIQETNLEFKKLSIEDLEASVGNFSVTQIKKEIKGLEDELEKVGADGIGGDAWLELREKIDIANEELQFKLLKPFKDLSKTELNIAVSNASKKELEKNIETLQLELNKLNPNSERFKELNDVLKLTKSELVKLDLESEVIPPLDLMQAKIDLVTKAAEGFTNAATAIGSFGGETEAAGEAVVELEKFLQGLAVVQSIQDGFKAWTETQKSATAATFTQAGALKVLKFALAATGIGAIVLILVALIQNFGGLKKVLSIVTDGLAAAQDAFKNLAGAITFDDVLARAKLFGDALVEYILAPFKIIGAAITELFSGGSISSAIDKAGAQLKKSAEIIKKGTIDQFAGLGTALADAFNKGFDTRQALRENERKKKLLETLNAERSARKSNLDAQLGDATKSFDQQKNLLRQSAALEQAAIADSLKLNRERMQLLRDLGKGISDEQKEELIELTKETAQQNADLQNARIAAAQAERDLLVSQQDFKLNLLAIETEKQTAILQKQLERGIAFQTLAAEEERKLIEETAALRLKQLDAEAEGIKARGKLTREEELRLQQITNEKATAETERDNALRESTQRRFDEAVALQDKLAEIRAAEFQNQTADLATLDKSEAARAEKRGRELDALAAKTAGFKAIEELRIQQAQELSDAAEFQTKQLQAQFELDKGALALEKEALELKIAQAKAQAELTGQTELQKAELQLLETQLQGLAKTSGQLELNLEIDKDKIQTDLAAGVKEGNKAALDAVRAELADPLGSAIRNGLINGLKLSPEDAALAMENLAALGEQAQEFIGQIFGLQGEMIDKQIAQIDEQIAGANERLALTEQALTESATRIDELSAKALESQGTQRATLLAQLDAQKEKEAALFAQKKKEEAAIKKAEAEKAALEKKKAENDKKQAKIELAIATAKAYVNAAVSIAQAGQAPPPLNLISIAAVIATILPAVASTLALATSFKMSRGGLLKGASHEQGGIPLFRNGTQIAEVEGGEAIITAAATKDPSTLATLSKINQDFGGVPLMANGGFAPTGTPLPSSNALLAETNAQMEDFANRPVVVSVQEIAEVQDRVRVIENASSY